MREGIHEDMLKCYFNNPKRSGGRDVCKVERGPEKGQVIVYFKDWKGTTQDVEMECGSALSQSGVRTIAD